MRIEAREKPRMGGENKVVEEEVSKICPFALRWHYVTV